MKKLHLFEIEANELPILTIGEWERVQNLTDEVKAAVNSKVIAYGELLDGKYIKLYERN